MPCARFIKYQLPCLGEDLWETMLNVMEEYPFTTQQITIPLLLTP